MIMTVMTDIETLANVVSVVFAASLAAGLMAMDGRGGLGLAGVLVTVLQTVSRNTLM
jgi:hypothetical protein